MNCLEYLLASVALRLVGAIASLRPIVRDRVVLATARTSALEGNLARIDAAIRLRRPDIEIVHLLEPYGYGLRAKAGYLLRLLRGMYHLQTAGLFVVDNAYLPIHVAPHRAATTVVQVWHAPSALKRFGLDALHPAAPTERRFLHRHYDYVVASADFAREPYARAFGIRPERVLPLGMPRADFFADAAAMAAARSRILGTYPIIQGRTVVVHAPTFRGRGRGRWATGELDAVALRRDLPDDHVLVLKAHPNLDPALTPTAGYDVVVDRTLEINDLFTVTDILVTDYSSSLFEYAILRRPLVLLVPDLEAYERDPGLYLDYRTEMIGTQVADTAGVIAAIVERRFDLEPYDAFIERHLGAADGRASDRFVESLLGPPEVRDTADA